MRHDQLVADDDACVEVLDARPGRGAPFADLTAGGLLIFSERAVADGVEIFRPYGHALVRFGRRPAAHDLEPCHRGSDAPREAYDKKGEQAEAHGSKLASQ